MVEKYISTKHNTDCMHMIQEKDVLVFLIHKKKIECASHLSSYMLAK